MKTSFLLLLLTFTSLSANAQITYQPYPETYATWFYEHQNSFGESDWYLRVVLSGDTTINGQSYNKIYMGGNTTGSMNPPPAMIYWGGLRQNPPTQQTFFIDETDTEYDISIDHSLQVGDTAPVTPYMFLAFNFVKSYTPEEFPVYDTITKMVVQQIIGGDTYDLLFLSEDGYTQSNVWYTSGHCTGVGYFEDGLSLRCWSVDGVMPPMMENDPLSNNCSLSIEENDPATAFAVFPNPASSFVMLASDVFSGKTDLCITDASGRTVRELQYVIGTEISVEDMKEGVYFLRFAIEGQAVSLPLYMVR